MTSNLWTCKKWTTVLGSLFLMLPIGLPWYWGNMAIYTRSYIARYGATDEGLQTPWIISFYFLFNAVGLFIAGLMSKYTGKRPVLCLGIVLFVGGMFFTILTVKHSVLMINITLGVISGIGGGIINGMALQYAVGWAGIYLGFITALVQSGFNAGPVFINPFITYRVNPENITPDSTLGPNKLFSQEIIIDRVPYLFRDFGILCTVFEVIGFILVRECQEKCPDEEIALNSNNSNGADSIISQNGTLNTTSKHLSKDLKPSEIIRTKSFYTLWFSLMMFDNSMLVLANYYKEYGAQWIRDDHFLTSLGTVLTLATTFAFSFWGALTDRFGVKLVLAQMFSVSSILNLCMYFTPRLSRWAYLVNVALSGWFLPPIFSILIIATCKLFGKTYYSSNIGVVASLSFMINFVNPMIFESILSVGWFYIFFYSACLTTGALILLLITLPKI